MEPYVEEMFDLVRWTCQWICDGVDGVVVFALFNFIILVHFLKRFFAFFGKPRATENGYVLVTGCDSGFGYACALELSKRNMHVFAGCLTQDGVTQLTNQSNFNGSAFIMDVTNTTDILNAKELITNRLKGKGLWAVVNNAGIFHIGPIEWQSVEKMQKTMDVNLWGAVNVTKIMLPLVKESRGRIVNITSMGGRVLLLNGTSYSMSKYALEAFSDGLRYEMKAWGVSVHIIEPGMFQTAILDKSILRKEWEDIWRVQPQEIKQSYGEQYLRSGIKMSDGLVDTFASPHMHKVSNAVCHAVLSSSPQPRYPVGYDAHTLWMAIAILPTSVGDFVTSLLAKPIVPSARKN